MKLLALTLAGILATSPIIVNINVTTSAWNSVNNESQLIDYKVDDFNSVKEEAKKITGNTDLDESITSEPISNTVNLGKELSYLIENDIISRQANIDVNNINNGTRKEFDLNKSFLKSDLYMALYKAKYGVIESRGIRFNVPSKRNGTVYQGVYKEWSSYYDEDTDTKTIYNRDFTKGDFWIYKAPDVYELYFYELLNKGIIDTDTLDGVDGETFVATYKDISINGTTPAWWSSKQQIDARSTRNALGASYTITSSGFERTNPRYFDSKTMQTMEALKIIENFLRATEKEMTNFEADIVTYKYGINYINNLNDRDKNTVEFLIAKGILNFEQSDEFINFYGQLTNDIAIKLIYRVANLNARFDFSTITLTDSESYWKAKGFLEDTIELSTMNSIPTSLDEQIEEQVEDIEGDAGEEDIFTIIGKLFTPKEVHADELKYTVIRTFPGNINFYYNKVAIKDLVKDDTITKIKYDKGTDSYKITFSVQSVSQASAVAFINNNITYDSVGDRSYIKGVTSVTNGGKSITLVPKSIITSTWTDIAVVKDKVLENKTTGSTAILLPEQGYALVGSQVIVSDYLMSEVINGEVYYNLEVIAALLPNSALVKIANMTSVYKVPDIPETNYQVFRNSSVSMGKTRVINFKNSSNQETGAMVNLSDFGNYSNMLYRTFNYDDTVDITMVVKYNYAVPDGSLTDSDMWWRSVNKSRTSTLQEINETLYTRPTDPLMQEWWDSNYGMSNALANFIYGTKGVEYITSGYLAPSVEILISNYNGDKEELVNSFFSEFDFSITNYQGVDYSKYVNHSKHNFHKSYFSEYSSEYKSLVALAKSTRKFDVHIGKAIKNNNDRRVGITGGTLYKSTSGVVYMALSSKNISVDNYNKTITLGVNKSERIDVQPNTIVYNATTQTEWIYLGTNESGYLVLLPAFEDKEILNTKQSYVNYFNRDGKLLYAPGHSIDSALALMYIRQNTEDNNVLDQFGTGIGTISLSKFLSITPSYKDISSFDSAHFDFLISKYYTKYFTDITTKAYKPQDPMELFGVSMLQGVGGSSSKAVLKEGNIYISNGKVVKIKDGKIVTLGEKEATDSTVHKSNVTVYPYIYLPADEYYLGETDGNKILLNRGYTLTALESDNVLDSTVGSSVIDRILYEELGGTTLKDIPVGSTVYMGGYTWTKREDYLESIIKNKKLVRNVKINITNDTKVTQLLKNLFTGKTIKLDKYTISLLNYIDEIRVGSSLDNSIKEGILYKVGSDYKIYKDKKNISLKKSANYVSVRIAVNEGLQFRQMGSDNTRYTLLNYSNLSVMSNSADIPFFSENLNYDLSLADSYSVEDTEYRNTTNSELAKKEYNKTSTIYWFASLRTLILNIITVLCAWVTVMLPIIYSTLRSNTLRAILDSLALRDGGSKKGFDLVRLFTLNIMSIDREISLFKVIGISFIAMLIGFIANGKI